MSTTMWTTFQKDVMLWLYIYTLCVYLVRCSFFPLLCANHTIKSLQSVMLQGKVQIKESNAYDKRWNTSFLRYRSVFYSCVKCDSISQPSGVWALLISYWENETIDEFVFYINRNQLDSGFWWISTAPAVIHICTVLTVLFI